MVNAEQMAIAALSSDALTLRALVQDWLRENKKFENVPAPSDSRAAVLAVTAGLAEMFAERAGSQPPPWTRDVPAAKEPIFLLREAANMKRLRQLCLEQSPEPLRRRRIYAPPNFLEFA